MSETKKEKTSQDILREYQQLALQLGQTEYQLNRLSNDKDMLVRAMTKVNLEYAAAEAKQNQEKAAAQKAEAEKALAQANGNVVELVKQSTIDETEALSEAQKTESENKENA